MNTIQRKANSSVNMLEYFPPLILNESLTILRKAYDVPPSLESVEDTIYDLLNSLLKGELQPDNYSDAVQYLKGISTSFESSRNKNKVDNSNTAVSKSENKGSPANSEETDIPKIFTNSSTGMEFVLIPAGKFMMGSPSDEQGRFDDEGPAHEVTIKNPFYLGKYPVTQKQWIAVMDSNPSCFIGDDLPVENVSWDDVQEFIKKLTEMENTDKYSLPSEAEWEYACRAGTITKYSFGGESKLEDYAWYFANSGGKTHPVGQKQPNPFGLSDMHGNVWEWVQDRWHDNYDYAPSDGSTWEYGNSSIRVFRGGGWNDVAKSCRSAIRDGVGSGSRSDVVGFRLLRKL